MEGLREEIERFGLGDGCGLKEKDGGKREVDETEGRAEEESEETAKDVEGF